MAVSWYEAWGPAVAPLWTQRGVPSDDFVGVVVQVTWDDTRGTYFVSSFVSDLCTASFLLLALSLNSCIAFGFCFVAFFKNYFALGATNQNSSISWFPFIGVCMSVFILYSIPLIFVLVHILGSWCLPYSQTWRLRSPTLICFAYHPKNIRT